MGMILYIAGGLIFFYLGAEGLVRGSSALALRLRISPLVVGLTVVAFGTSAPELVVSLKASLMKTDFTLKRWEGGILLFVYIGYIVLLFP